MRYFLLTVLFIGYVLLGKGQINIQTGSSITQNFNSMGASSTLPSNWKVLNSSTVRDNSLSFASASTSTSQSGGNGISTSASNGTYKFNANNVNTESAIGGLSSGSASKTVTLFCELINNGATTISNFTISYNVEKFRNGSNSSGFSIQLLYSTNGSTWVECGNDFLTSFSADGNNDGFANAPGVISSVTSKNYTPALSVANNAIVYFGWRYSVTTGTTTSNAQAIGVDDISIQANASSACSGTPTGGTAAASVTSGACTVASSTLSLSGNSTGTGITYQWQSSAAGANTWSDIPTATSATYEATNVTASTDYRCNVTCVNSSTTTASSTTTVTINSLAGGTASAGTASGICTVSSSNITVSGASTGTGITYQWQSSPAGANTWTNITTGGTNASYSATSVTASTDYRRQTICSAGGSAFSAAATVTVNAITGGTASTGSVTGACSMSATISVTGASSGTGVTYQWESSPASANTWSDINTSGTSATYNASSVTVNTDYRRKTICNGSTTVTSTTATITVTGANAGTAQVSGGGSTSICYGNTATINLIGAATSGSFTRSWQSSTNGVSYTAIGESGANFVTPALTSEIYYRCVFTCTGGTVTTSTPVHLTINTTPDNVTGASASSENAQSAISWTNAGCYNEILIVAATAANNGTPAGNGSAYTGNNVFGAGTALGNGFVVYKGTTSPQTITGLSNGTTYYFKIFTRVNTTWSSGVEVSAQPSAYCFPTYTNGCGSGIDAITKVELNTLINNSTCSGLPNYTFYNAVTVPDLTRGNSSIVSVTMGSDNTQYSGVWIDFDQNGIFEAVEFFSNGTNAGANGTSNITVNIPSDAILGNTRMRVRGGHDNAVNSSEPCAVISYGEAEDYIVNIIGGLDAPVATAATFVAGNRINANWTNVTDATFYKLDVSEYSDFQTAGASSSIQEGFNAGISQPSGWIFENIGGTYTTNTNYGTSSPSVQFDNTGDKITTIEITGLATELSFWIKGQGTNSTSAMLIEGYENNNWITIRNFNSLPTTGQINTYNASTPGITWGNFTRFRFSYTKSNGNVALDDITINYTSSTPSFVTGYNDLDVGNVSTHEITGLNPLTTYYYRVRAVNASTTSANSNTESATTIGCDIWVGFNDTITTTANNWSCDMPDASSDIIIPAGATNFPTITAATSYNSITVHLNAELRINNNLSIRGNIINNGTINGTGTLTLNGTAAQNISGDIDINSVILANNNTRTITINDSLRIVDSIGFANNANNITLQTAGNITLKSSLNKTARIGRIPSSSVINGNVTVERYLNGSTVWNRRRWHLLTLPVGATIRNAWQESGTDDNGYGTFITDPINNVSGTNGYDVGTGLASASIKQFINNGTTLETPANTTTTQVAGNAYFVFLRGNRTIHPNATGGTYSDANIRGTGNINQGTVTLANAMPATGFAVVGNPYPSPVNFSDITISGGNATTGFKLWDPAIGGNGGYVDFDNDGTPAGGHSPTYGSQTSIQSGQAFLVSSTNVPGDIVFNESSKTTTNDNQLRLNNTIPKLDIWFYKRSGSTYNYMDATAAYFNTNFSNEFLASEDVNKAWNNNENFCFWLDNKYVSIDRRGLPQATDTLNLVQSVLTSTYKLQIYTSNMTGINDIFLYDKYLNKEVVVNMNGMTEYVYSVNTSIAASKDYYRFIVYFKQSTALPVNFININARKKDNNVNVEWKVGDEKSVAKYTVERSADGNDFSAIGNVISKNTGNISYIYSDENPLPNTNFYRVKAIEKDGSVKYSNVVKLNFEGKGIPSVIVSPNPVINKTLSLNISDLQQGNYTVSVYGIDGKIFYTESLFYAGGSRNMNFQLPETLKSGVHEVVVSGKSGKFTQKVFVE